MVTIVVAMLSQTIRARARATSKIEDLRAEISAAQPRAEAAKRRAQAAKEELKRVRKIFKGAKKISKAARKKLKNLRRALEESIQAGANPALPGRNRKSEKSAKPAKPLAKRPRRPARPRKAVPRTDPVEQNGSVPEMKPDLDSAVSTAGTDAAGISDAPPAG